METARERWRSLLRRQGAGHNIMQQSESVDTMETSQYDTACTAARQEWYSDDLASASIEEPLCNYLGAFDGSAKEFRDIRHRFDELFSDNMIHLMDGRPIDKRCFVHINKRLLDEKMVATLEDIYFVDDDHVEYTVHWSNGHASMVTHIVALVVEGKIALAKPCAETQSVFANMIAHCQSMSDEDLRHPLHQWMKFGRGWAGRVVTR